MMGTDFSCALVGTAKPTANLVNVTQKAAWTVALSMLVTMTNLPTVQGAWLETDKLYNQTALADSWAGWGAGKGVSISGDTIILGAPQPNNGEAGEAYIFERNGTGWSHTATLAANDGIASDQFGYAVAIDGSRAVVSAHRGDAAYVFDKVGGTWQQSAKLTGFDGVGQSPLDGAIAISGDQIVIGSPHDTDQGHFTGAAYLFEYDGTSWGQATRFTASDQSSHDGVGTSVSISGNTVMVGAVDARDQAGAVYVYENSPLGWQEIDILTPSDNVNQKGGFGWSLSLDGNRAAIGRIRSNDAGTSSGSAYIFEDTGSGWQEVAKLTASNATTGDQFGSSIALDGNYAVVSSLFNDELGSNAGAAYLFEYDGSNWNEIEKLTLDSGVSGDLFGYSVDIEGQYAVVTTHSDDTAATDAGAAYVYTNFVPEPGTVGMSLFAFAACATVGRRSNRLR